MFCYDYLMTEKILNHEPLVLSVIDRINAIKADQDKFNALQEHLPEFVLRMNQMMTVDFSDKPLDELDKVDAYHALKSSSKKNIEELADVEVEQAVEHQIHALLDEFESKYTSVQ
jgi:hypothetical protein